MNPEERLYAALDGRKTDRIATFSFLSDANITAQVFSHKPSKILPILRSELGGAVVERLAGPLGRLFSGGQLLFDLQVGYMNYRLGFDSYPVVYWPGGIVSRSEVEDVYGRRFSLMDDGFGNAYPMYNGGIIESPEQWRVRRRPSIAAFARTAARLYGGCRAVLADRIAPVPFVAPGPWENSWQPMGFSRFVALARKDPGFAREAAGYFSALSAACVDAYCRAGARVLCFADDLAYKSGPMLAPGRIDELYGAGYRTITATAHRYGAKIIIHCCGNTESLLPLFLRWGFDGAHAFEPSAGNDFARARSAVGDRFALVGNIDVTSTLVDGSREQVEAEVRKAIDDSAGGPFVLAPAHTHPGVSAERVRWMLDAGRQREKELDETYSAGYRDTPEDTCVSAAQEEMLGEVLNEESW